MNTPFQKITIFWAFLLFSFAARAQEEPKSNDTIRVRVPELPANIATQGTQQTSDKAIVRPLLHPELPTQFRPLTFSLLKNTAAAESRLSSHVNIRGYGHDFFNNAERTAIFSANSQSGFTPYVAATLGVHKTLMYGNINYYNVDVGGAFSLNSAVGGNAGVFYRSNLEMPLPMRGAYLNMNYMVTDRLQVNGGISYRNLHAPQFNLNQHSLRLDGHLRYRIAEDWYVNGYGGMPVFERGAAPNGAMHPMMPQTYVGGTVEYWFQPTMGVEGGVIWQQDMFGKLRPTPKFELKIDPKRR